MTPPGVQDKKISSYSVDDSRVWNPSGGDSTCGKCHSSQPAPAVSTDYLSVQPDTAWFLDSQPKINTFYDPQAAVKAYVANLKVNPPPAPTPTVTPAPATTPKPATAPAKNPVPGPDPTDQEAKDFLIKAKQEEKLAKATTDPEKKIRHYQLAYLHYLSAKDGKQAKRILGIIGCEYEKRKNPDGLKMVAADQLIVDGNLSGALAAYQGLETELKAAGANVPEASRQALLKEVDTKITWTLRALASESLEKYNRKKAAYYLEILLGRHPSPSLLKQILGLLDADRGGSLQEKRKKIEDLDFKAGVKRSRPCQVSCHTQDKPRFTVDFKTYKELHGHSPLYNQFSNGLNQPEIDLSPYDDLTHLSWKDKEELFYLDAELADEKRNFPESTERVTRVLKTYFGENWNGEVEPEEARLLGDRSRDLRAEKVSPQLLAGELYLEAKEYDKAAASFEIAAQGQNFEPTAKVGLGKAYFGQGEYGKAFEAYGAYTKVNPRDTSILRLRIEAAEKYAATLDPTQDSTELTRVSTEVQKDNAMLLALGAKAERERLAQLETKLGELHDSPMKADLITSLEGLGQQYLTLAGEGFDDIKDLELVRGELNSLAAETFGILQRFAKADSDPAIQKTATLYEAYALMANGKLDEGMKILETIRKDVTAADKILSKMEADKLKFANLAALEAWEAYNMEGEAIQADNQSGILGGIVNYGGKLFTWDSDYSIHDERRAQWDNQRALVAELKSRIESGQIKTIAEGLDQIRANGPDNLKSAANSQHLGTMYKGHPIGPMVQFVSQIPPDPLWTEALLRTTFELEADNNAAQSPFALYSLVHAFTQGTSSEGMSFNGTAWDHMEALQGRGSFGRSAMKFIFSTSPESLAIDVGLLVASAGLGNLAKLAMLTRLEQAGVTGYKALAIATAAGIGVEATALWAGNTAKEAMLRDPSKVFTVEHLTKSYGATLLMIGGLKGFGQLGQTVGPRAAKGLGLVTEGGTALTATGKALVWGIGHTSGLTGMIATSHLNQGLGLTPKPMGGWKEGLVHDVFGYVQFAVAHKAADGLFAGKLSTFSKQQHNEIAVKEALTLARGQADRMGFKAGRGPKGELVESPERKILVTLLVEASLSRPGFNGGKLAKLVETRQFEKANQYLAENGLPIQIGKGGKFYAVTLGEKAPHEAIGIEPKPASKKPAKISPQLKKELVTAVNQILDSIANFLFPGGGGGLGPQLAFQGAYGMAGGKKPTKTSMKPTSMMMESLENFELGLMDRNVAVASHDAAKNPKEVTVKVEATKPEDLPFIAETAIKELPKEVKKLEIVLDQEPGLGLMTDLAKLAKDRGIEITVGKEKTNGHTEFIPSFRIVDGKIRVLSVEKLDANTLSAYLLIAKDKGLDIAFGKEVKNGHTEFFPSVEYTQTSGVGRLTFKGEAKTAEGKKEALTLIGEAAKMDPALFKEIQIEVRSLPIEVGKPFPSEVNALLRTAMWGSCNQFKLGTKGEVTVKAGATGKFNYSFSTTLDFPQARGVFAEFLAFEGARTAGAKGPQDPSAVFFRRYFDQAMEHVWDFYNSKTQKREDATEFQPYVAGNWTKGWKISLDQMMNFAATNQTQFMDVMGRIEKYSQPEAGHLLGLKGFDGRAFADNAFELMRIFEAVGKIPDTQMKPSERIDGLRKILGKVQETLGPSKNLEVTGATVGVIYKTVFQKNRNGQPDSASLNEGERLIDMINAVNTQKWSGKYRFTFIPEDRFLGNNSAARTKTPDLMVEALSDSGKTEKVVTIEINEADGSMPINGERSVGRKVNQILGSKFSPANNQGDGVIALRLYTPRGDKAVPDYPGRLKEIQDYLAAMYRANPTQGRAMEKIRVMVICEGDAGKRTYWVEYAGNGQWKPRTLPDKAVFSRGTLWNEPLKKVMGW